jgi:hypothetical protein
MPTCARSSWGTQPIRPTPDRANGIHGQCPDRADAHLTELIDLARALTHVTQPFFYLLSHFAIASAIFWFCSVILLQYQTFCYSVLNHSGIVNSTILLSHFMVLQAIFATLNSVIFAIMLSHFSIATCLVIPRWCSAQSFFDCYIAQSFCDFSTVNSTILCSY